MSNRLFFHEFSPRKVWKSQKSVPPNVKNEASDHLKKNFCAMYGY